MIEADDESAPAAVGRLRSAAGAVQSGPAAWRESYRRSRYLRSLASTRLLRAFERAHPDAVFVQVGSNDGHQHDPLKQIIERRWRGLMVEPVPFVFERLRRNYGRYADRITLDNVAVGERDGIAPFFHLAPVADHRREGLPQWYDGIGSFHREHVLKHAGHIPDVAERLVCTEVPVLTFESLCRKHAVDRVDLVHIDAEGADFEVIRSIDLEHRRPRLLVYEHYHQEPEERAGCVAHLEAHGYETLECGMDTWCLSMDPPGPGERHLLHLWEALKGESPYHPPSTVRRLVTSRPVVKRVAAEAWRRVKVAVEEPRRAEVQYWIDYTLQQMTPFEWSLLTRPYDDTVPLPAGADAALASDHPDLVALRAAYRDSGLPVTQPSIWNDDLLSRQLDLRYFRGESPFVWHYRELPRAMILKYFVFSQYVRGRDHAGLLGRLEEDGAFGCWTFSYPGHPPVSRDLLDSVNELSFLDRHLGLLGRRGLKVLDIGAGYGRTAHRMTSAADVDDYCCVDAVPESTFVCDYYLRHRGCAPPARVLPLHELEDGLPADHFDLAVNIHSFSECRYEAVAWWFQLLERLHIPDLFIIPNDTDAFLSWEEDGTRLPFLSLIEGAGYRLVACEPVVEDPAVRELLQLHDRFYLFSRET